MIPQVFVASDHAVGTPVLPKVFVVSSGGSRLHQEEGEEEDNDNADYDYDYDIADEPILDSISSVRY